MKVETFNYADGGEQLSFANPSGEVLTITAVPYSQLDLTRRAGKSRPLSL
jgi:hypothetical protein